MCSLGVVIPPYGKRRNLRAFFILKGDDEMIRVAILVDGGYYIKRANRLFGQKTAAERAIELEEYCKKMHVAKSEAVREAIDLLVDDDQKVCKIK